MQHEVIGAYVKGACSPEDIALKSFFLGPQSENAIWLQSAVHDLLVHWFEWRQGRFVEDGRAISSKDQATPEFRACRQRMTEALAQLSKRFEAEVPKYSPRYVGHMFSEIAMPAMLGHLLALLHNPNLVSGESARVGVQIEREAIAALIAMIGYPQEVSTGHFTSGGSVANFEAVTRARARVALWMAVGCALGDVEGTEPDPCADAVMGWARFDQMLQRLKSKDSQWPSRLNSWHFELIGFHKFASRCLETFGMNIEHPVMLVPAHRHYCWQKAAALFGFGDETMKIVHLDEQGRLDVAHLRQRLLSARQSHHPVMMVVSVAGTTEMGAMDPVADVSATCKSIGVIWHHLDAAYGGFFASLRDVEAAENSHGMSDDFLGGVRSFCLADSITIDPHKLGYVPYAAGVFLLRDGRDYDLHSIDAPYIQYDAADRGPVTIEGSRPATGAAATWMLAKTMPLNAGGFGRILLRHFMARRVLEDALCASTLPIRVVKTSESNVLCFVVAAEGESLSVVNQRSHELYRALSGPDARFFVSKTTIFWQNASALCERFSGSWGAQCDTGSIVLLRMCLMNPFFTSSETLVAYSREFVREIEFILRGT